MPCLDANVKHWLSAATRSLHPGGVNVVSLDGHVDFFTNDVDEYVMAYLISVNDGRSLGTSVPDEPLPASSSN